MPTYVYKAKDGPGRTVEGELVRATRAEVLAALDQMALTPVRVSEKEAAPAAGGGRRRVPLRRVRSRDITVFSRQLAGLLRAGVPMLRALSTIEEQTENTAMRRIVGDVGASIRDGMMLSEALAAYPRLFNERYIGMARAGESGGVLDRVLERLSDAREQEEDTRRKVQAALAYPALILVVGLATVFVLLAFFLPRVVGLFRDFSDLPLATRVLLSASDFFSANWHWMALVLLLAAAVVNRLAAMERGRMFLDRAALRLPLFGRYLRDADIARFSRTLALLLDAGIAIDRAIALSCAALRNAVLRSDMEGVRLRTVKHGEPFSTALRSTPWFPPMLSNMAAVGEEAGNLEAALNDVGSFLEKECDYRSRMATSLLEPALILGIGAIVGFIVAAMLLPIFQVRTGG